MEAGRESDARQGTKQTYFGGCGWPLDVDAHEIQIQLQIKCYKENCMLQIQMRHRQEIVTDWWK